jgi:hypothetical protein
MYPRSLRRSLSFDIPTHISLLHLSSLLHQLREDHILTITESSVSCPIWSLVFSLSCVTLSLLLSLFLVLFSSFLTYTTLSQIVSRREPIEVWTHSVTRNRPILNLAKPNLTSTLTSFSALCFLSSRFRSRFLVTATLRCSRCG